MKNLNQIKANAANSGQSEALAVLGFINDLESNGADDGLAQSSLLELASWALAFHDSIDQSKCGLTSLVLDDDQDKELPLMLAMLDQMTDDMGLSNEERAFFNGIETQIKAVSADASRNYSYQRQSDGSFDIPSAKNPICEPSNPELRGAESGGILVETPDASNYRHLADGGTLEVKIKDWYSGAYSLGRVGRWESSATFQDLQQALDNKTCPYGTIGVHDSVIRERCFSKLAELRGVGYQVIYNQWLDAV